MKKETNLPESCYGMLLVDNSLIIINALESGYHKVVTQPTKAFLEQELGKNGDPVGFINSAQDMAEAMNDFIDMINSEKGVTKAQRKAMEWGSQFGWSHGLSNPDSYDEDGRPYSASNPRKETV